MILVDTNEKLPSDITLQHVVIFLITCNVKSHNKLYPQIFLKEAFEA